MPTVATDHDSYEVGGTIQWRGSGFTPGGTATPCITSAGPGCGAILCAGSYEVDGLGNVSGSFGVGGNISSGSQDFMVRDNSTGSYSSGIRLAISSTLDITTSHFQFHFQGPINGDFTFFTRYLEAAHAAVSNMLGITLDDTVSGRTPPFPVIVQPSSVCAGGIGASAGDGRLTYCAGDWSVNRLTMLVVPHELVNLMTGECVTGGWPREWWANHRSPFPRLVATTFMRTQGYTTEADANDAEVANDPTYHLHKVLVESFNWTPYKEMFTHFRQQRINLDSYPEPMKTAIIAASLIRFGVPQETMLGLLAAANITGITNATLAQVQVVT